MKKHPCLWILLAALAVNAGLGFVVGFDKPMESDALYFREFAESMAAGKGFTVDIGFWPGQPSMQRFPGWPFAVSLVLRVLPGAAPDVVVRAIALLVNAAAACAVFALTRVIFRNQLWATLAGAAYVFHPTALYVAQAGLSEPFFVLLAVSGILLLMRDTWGGRWAGSLLMGCACLVRGNLLLWPVVVVAAAVASWARSRRCPRLQLRDLLAILTCGGLIVGPSMLWAARNYRICNRFPVLSSLEGQTFYGGNNAVVAENREFWGYWVFPDDIPGETPMSVLAGTLSEYGVSEYYSGKGKAYIRNHWAAMPRLLVGKLVRAYIPVPWKRSPALYAVNAVRALLYVGMIFGLIRLWGKTDARYRLFLVGVAVTGLSTTLVFWGNSRFSFVFEPFFLPFFGATAGWIGTALFPFMRKDASTWIS